MMKTKKGSMTLSDLAPVAIAFVFVAIVIGVGADVLADINADQTANSTADNATQAGLDGLGELSSWLPTLALVIAAAVVIGVLSFFRA